MKLNVRTASGFDAASEARTATGGGSADETGTSGKETDTINYTTAVFQPILVILEILKEKVG